ncbi:MAG TPA: DinB superfamily protein, partial [Bacteroidia bacterium]|nr:DinB superfamily protein [Bacteroidia bacterium]
MVAEFAAEIFERELNKLIEEIKLYPNEGKIWQLTAGIKNSGGNLCMHICGNLQHFIGHVLGNSGYIRNRDREFTVTNIPAIELIAEIQKTTE